MVDTLVKLWQSNKSKNPSEDLRDLVKGYQDFEHVCSMWNTFIYMHDYRSKKYIYISPSFCSYLGVDYNNALNDGFDSISSYIHPDDFLILENVLFKKITTFLSALPEKQQDTPDNYRFSYNFRIKKKDGEYISVSIVSKILGFNKKGKIHVDFGLIAPVNHILQSDKIILNISTSQNDVDYVTLLQEEYNPVASSEINLTKRELMIIELLKKGMNSKDMADQLCLSQHTVRNHRRNILKKTNTNKVVELLSLLTKLGI
ncbi:MAG TPA: LuxR C-terminal-related transcriptional regulator [Cytophagaceae bacterium]|jgi:DNA-binding CsgD family transcriptional regulator|nr:LuxR C-terminal-related transcriptional regulator [Cytophagaceae bacterium]HSZ86120.1 LuxR C-terminal-related transcriptional regulator [Puia sp.]